MDKITKFTICCHCGCDRAVVENQMNMLSPLSEKYDVLWNNRIDRHPGMYESFSELMNHSIASSETEWVITLNDRTSATVAEMEKVLDLLQNGFSCVFLYNAGFIGLSKELIRKIGWWDQRFRYGGWEDRDWVFRLKMNDLAFYESQESTYDYSWKSPLNVPGCHYSTPHWNAKYSFEQYNIIKLLEEEKYPQWENCLGEGRPDISSSWKSWKDSKLNIMYDLPNSGPSASSMIQNRNIISKTING